MTARAGRGDTRTPSRSPAPGRRFPIEAFLLLQASLWLWLALTAAPADTTAPHGPVLLTPARPDTNRAPESSAQPLLIPGRPYAPDSLTRSRGQKAREHLAHARKLESDGNPTAALVEYQNAVGLDPTLPGAYQHMGQIYEAFGWLENSVKCYAAEVQHHPENHVAARLLGVALIRVGEIERGTRQLELLTHRYPRDGADWRALGYAYTQAKRFDEAEHALRMAIDLPPLEAEELRDLGVLLGNRGREKEARELYLRAARLDPKDGLVWVNLGNLDARAGRYEQALASYRTGAERDSIAILAYRGQVRALEALGRDDQAGDVYRRWLRCAPNDDEGRLDAVRYFVKQGRGDVALELGRDGVRLHPKSSDAHMVMAVAYGATGDARSSLVELRRAQAFATDPDTRKSTEGMIAELRAGAPDSLRSFFVADSIAAYEAAKRDSARAAGVRPRKPGIP